MKKLITNYAFNKAAKTVTLLDYEAISHAGILLITNVTDNIIIYDFTKPALLGVVTDNYITLNYDTSGMADTDILQIWYDDAESLATKTDMENLVFVLQSMVQKMSDLPIWYNAAINGLTVGGAVTVSGSLTTAGTVSTVTTLSNLAAVGGNTVDMLMINLSETDWALTTRNVFKWT